MNHVVIDTLHLFLRISDVLIELLIKELRTQDAIQKREVFNGGFNRERHKAMAKYETFLNSLGISFHWEIDLCNSVSLCLFLTGPEKIDILEILSGAEEKHKIKLIWNHFIDLLQNLN